MKLSSADAYYIAYKKRKSIRYNKSIGRKNTWTINLRGFITITNVMLIKLLFYLKEI